MNIKYQICKYKAKQYWISHVSIVSYWFIVLWFYMTISLQLVREEDLNDEN